MDERILKLLGDVKSGTLSVEQAYERLKDVPFEDLSHTKVDHHRLMRKGIQEIVFGEGKTTEQLADIVRSMRAKELDVLVTRIGPEAGQRLRDLFPEGLYNGQARLFCIQRETTIRGAGTVLVVSAGTSDMPVAEEAFAASTFLGNRTERLYDVGVAGIHRLLYHLDVLRNARVIIVCAGMEGALPSIIGGIVSVPVIAVPTSTGYGASFHGLAALLSMLNSCATVAVFNIDNGFGAAYFATLINRL